MIRSLTQPIGILFNDSAISQSPLNEAIQETLAVYCSLLGNIIERKRLEERERDMVHRLHAVVDCADELIRCENLDTLYRRAVELAREKLNVERCSIFLLDEAREYYAAVLTAQMIKARPPMNMKTSGLRKAGRKSLPGAVKTD